MLTTAIWCVGSMMEYGSRDIAQKILWVQFEYAGRNGAPVFFLLFCLEYAQIDKRLTRPQQRALFCIPLLIQLLAATNSYHHLVWTGVVMNAHGAEPIVLKHSIGYSIALGYGFILTLIGSICLFWTSIRYAGVYRRQALAVIAGAIFPRLVNIFNARGLMPELGHEWTPVAIAVTGMAFAIGIFVFKLVDVVPIARETLIETMSDGIIVLDAANRILDVNPAARRILSVQASGVARLEPGDIVERLPMLGAGGYGLHELKVESNADSYDSRHIEILITPIDDRQGNASGKLILLRDVTEQKRSEGEVRLAHAALQSKVAEIELLQEELRVQATTDALTQLYNRRYLDAALERELLSARECREPLSIVMLDIDHFKRINDTYGHHAGDEILIQFAELLRSRAGERATVCRYGGEEFLVLLPATSIGEAEVCVEQWRRRMEEMVVPFGSSELRATISAGLAEYPTHGETSVRLLQLCDRALYRAKDLGRNRIEIAPSSPSSALILPDACVVASPTPDSPRV
jgi:diguanylate cyclase (GGDEF)-like protein